MREMMVPIRHLHFLTSGISCVVRCILATDSPRNGLLSLGRMKKSAATTHAMTVYRSCIAMLACIVIVVISAPFSLLLLKCHANWLERRRLPRRECECNLNESNRCLRRRRFLSLPLACACVCVFGELRVMIVVRLDWSGLLVILSFSRRLVGSRCTFEQG